VTVQITTTQASVGTCQQASSNSQQATCGGQAGAATSTTIRTVTTQQGAATLALHDFVYKSDFAGLRENLKVLNQAENHPTLIGALQSTDDKVRVPSDPGIQYSNPNVLVQSVTSSFCCLRRA
jgi:hypothetical protein